MIGMGIIISISAVIFGYGLTEISTIPIGTLAEIYGITFSHSVAQSILIGIMPVGGIFGAAINQFFIKHFNRKNSLLIICGLMLLSVGLLMITTQYTLIIGRFI
jgi:predicted MFS family arabinose efflux permease